MATTQSNATCYPYPRYAIPPGILGWCPRSRSVILCYSTAKNLGWFSCTFFSKKNQNYAIRVHRRHRRTDGQTTYH